MTDDYGFIYTEVTGSGFSFTVPATTTLRTLYVLVGGGGPTPTLRASLSDFSAADFVDTGSAASQYQNVYAIPFRAASAGQTLTVTYTKTAGGGSVDLKAAWLVGNPTAPPTAPPLLLSVQSVGNALTGQGSLVTLVFDERMDQTSAETVSNYSIDGGSVAISGAVLQPDLKRVVLTTGGITPSVNHSLNVTGVKDRFGNTMAPASKASSFRRRTWWRAIHWMIW